MFCDLSRGNEDSEGNSEGRRCALDWTTLGHKFGHWFHHIVFDIEDIMSGTTSEVEMLHLDISRSINKYIDTLIDRILKRGLSGLSGLLSGLFGVIQGLCRLYETWEAHRLNSSCECV